MNGHGQSSDEIRVKNLIRTNRRRIVPCLAIQVRDGTTDKKAFQLQPGDVLAVPTDKRNEIVSEAQAHGVTNPTEQQIRDRYFQMLQPAPSAQPQLVQRPVKPTSLRVK